MKETMMVNEMLEEKRTECEKLGSIDFYKVFTLIEMARKGIVPDGRWSDTEVDLWFMIRHFKKDES